VLISGSIKIEIINCIGLYSKNLIRVISKKMTDYILSNLVDMYDFRRIREHEPANVDGLNTWEAFVAWNTQCIAALSDEERVFLKGLCSMLEKSTLRMVDMESCSEWRASGFYFNAKKVLCIVHPR